MAAIGKAFAAQGIFGRKRPFPDAAVFDLPPVDPSAAGQHQPIGKGMAAFDKAADGDVSAARPARPRWKAAAEEVAFVGAAHRLEIGRASCRERECQYG